MKVYIPNKKTHKITNNKTKCGLNIIYDHKIYNVDNIKNGCKKCFSDEKHVNGYLIIVESCIQLIRTETKKKVII